MGHTETQRQSQGDTQRGRKKREISQGDRELRTQGNREEKDSGEEERGAQTQGIGDIQRHRDSGRERRKRRDT